MKESGNKHKVICNEEVGARLVWHKPIFSDLKIKNTYRGAGGHYADGTSASVGTGSLQS